jgi:GNAT superfamily N-acetyltransferase
LLNKMMQLLTLPNGYYELPHGKLANVVTCLEMRGAPQRSLKKIPPGLNLRRFTPDEIESFRRLFRKIGEDWMWFSRLIMADEKLAAILGDPDVLSFALHDESEALGLLELDFRQRGECELSFFGLARAAIGKGLGRALMDEGLALAWARPISRLWVHTCTFDSPDALPFYIRSGFTPYARMIEIHDDARLAGKLPLTASPQVPLIGSR